jgi:hypothetical protein
MLNVYNFKFWDAGCGVWVYPVFKTTFERIKKAGGKVIVGTKEQVDPSALRADGGYLSVQAKMGRNNRKHVNNNRNDAVRAA